MVSCTTKQHWELLLEAGVVIGEARERDLVDGNIGEVENALVRDDGADTGDKLGIAECDKFTGFEGGNVDFAVVFVVPRKGAGRVMEVFKREYGDSIVMFGNPWV